MNTTITISEHIFINRPPEAVWEFTQDYSRRTQWDSSILDAGMVRTQPLPLVRIRARGGLSCFFEYKLFDKPRATSLTMTSVESPLIDGGGGSWQYVAKDGGTLWTQVNAVTLRERKLSHLLRPVISFMLRQATRKAMNRAKRILEAKSARPPFK